MVDLPHSRLLLRTPVHNGYVISLVNIPLFKGHVLNTLLSGLSIGANDTVLCVLFSGVSPDDEMGYLLHSIFGGHAHAFRKYRRMMYWMPKFKYSNPYHVPYELPDDSIELAKMALKRMCPDKLTRISVHEVSGVFFNIEVSVLFSVEICKLLAFHLLLQHQHLKCTLLDQTKLILYFVDF